VRTLTSVPQHRFISATTSRIAAQSLDL